jgi:hypothetical protein
LSGFFIRSSAGVAERCKASRLAVTKKFWKFHWQLLLRLPAQKSFSLLSGIFKIPFNQIPFPARWAGAAYGGRSRHTRPIFAAAKWAYQKRAAGAGQCGHMLARRQFVDSGVSILKHQNFCDFAKEPGAGKTKEIRE